MDDLDNIELQDVYGPLAPEEDTSPSWWPVVELMLIIVLVIFLGFRLLIWKRKKRQRDNSTRLKKSLTRELKNSLRELKAIDKDTLIVLLNEFSEKCTQNKDAFNRLKHRGLQKELNEIYKQGTYIKYSGNSLSNEQIQMLLQRMLNILDALK